jgi:hypothetical protein
MTRLQTLTIVVAMIVSFVVTVAMLLPQQRGDSLRLASLGRASGGGERQALATRAGQPAAPAPVPAPAMPAAAPAAPIVAASRAAADDTAAPPAASLQRHAEGPELPLIVTIRDKALVTAEERAAGIPKKLVTLFNSSGKPLDLSVIDLNPPTQESSSSRLNLRGGMQGYSGTDSGLKMSSGDELVIQSPGYRDMSLTVP